jgi:hypothetical protein
MATVTEAIRKIVGSPENIADVYVRGNEHYFHFGGHSFSVLSRADQADIDQYGEHTFYVYPKWGGRDLNGLAMTFEFEGSTPADFVAYHENDLPDSSKWHLKQLAKVLEEKSLNVPNIFDHIVKLD